MGRLGSDVTGGRVLPTEDTEVTEEQRGRELTAENAEVAEGRRGGGS
jgi:hypothetical protein